MYEALKNPPKLKSLLEEAAYTGGDVPQKWIEERSQYIAGYNQAINDIQQMAKVALAKAEGRDG
jgi:hypothetical protein